MRNRWAVCLAAAALALAMASPATARGVGGGAANSEYQVKVMVRGAPIHGANGLAVDAGGRLLVASGFGGEIVVLDTRSGQVLDRLGHDAGVDLPDDVAVAPDGSIYWTDLPIGEVGRLAPDGTVTKQFVGVGVNPVAVRADGRLFVAQAFFGNGLYELDPLLVGPPRIVIPDTDPTGGATQLNGFDFGPDGFLYSPQPFMGPTGRVVRIDPDTGAMTTVTAALPAPPSSVEFNSTGELYATLVVGAVVEIDLATGSVQMITEIPGASFDNMTFDAADNLFVSDSDTGAIYSVAPGGGVRALSQGGLILPGGAAVVQDGSGHESLFVADLWRLVELDARSGRVVDIDSGDVTGVGLNNPITVAADGGNLILASWFTNSVQIWDPVAGAQVAIFGDFALPMNAVRFQGNLVVAQLGTGSVVSRDAAGVTTTIASGLYYPTGLATTDDDLWVADWATGVVWKVVADGVTLSPPQFVAGGLHFPEGMAVDHDGSLLVVEAAGPGIGRLLRIDPISGQVTTVVDGLATGVQGSMAMPPSFALSSVAVASTGTVYVTGDLGSVVYRLQPLRAG
jgi:sugar lactone lactonase YvrE